MRVLDLLGMSASNLLRRKLRTILTVLGVVIGTSSIVVMLSLGLGLRKNSMEQIEKAGGLTTITVYSNEDMGNQTIGRRPKRLDDEVVENIAKIHHVKLVSPVLQVQVLAKFKNFECYLTIEGMNQEALQAMNLKVGKGHLPTAGKPLELFFGNQVQNMFYAPRGNVPMPTIDFQKDTIFYIFDIEAYNRFKNPSGNETPATIPKKYLIPVSGILAGDEDEYLNGSYDVYADLDALIKHLKVAFHNKPIPGQPTNKNGRAFKQIYYNTIHVRADSVEAMEMVQKAIRDMGFEADSNTEWLKQTQEQMRTIQMMLGGIGAVSLFVAAIGIANTMMMSIYERTKEIGILKVLGCDLRDIHRTFLMEAGFIGLVGGCIGVALSCGISVFINIAAQSSDYQGISYIPSWLVLLAIVFSTIMGMIAGFFPAFRAMHLSPLAALRNE